MFVQQQQQQRRYILLTSNIYTTHISGEEENFTDTRRNEEKNNIKIIIHIKICIYMWPSERSTQQSLYILKYIYISSSTNHII